MKNILKQILISLVFVSITHALLWMFLFKLYPSLPIIDLEKHSSTVYKTTPRYLLMEKDALSTKKKKVLMLGASNIKRGFYIHQLQKDISEYEFHNVGFGAANFYLLNQIVDVVYESLNGQAGPNIFVVGIWYGTLSHLSDAVSEEGTRIDMEKKGMGFYREIDGELKPIFPEQYAAHMYRLIRPFVFLDHFINRISFRLVKVKRHFIPAADKPKEKTQQASEVPPNETEEQRRARLLKKRHEHYGIGDQSDTKSYRQLQYLNKLAKTIEDRNDVLVILDLPIPDWHAEGSVFHQKYQEMKKPFIRKLIQSDQIYYINIQDMDDPRDYSDSAHPHNNVREKWSARLADELQPILSQLSATQ